MEGFDEAWGGAGGSGFQGLFLRDVGGTRSTRSRRRSSNNCSSLGGDMAVLEKKKYQRVSYLVFEVDFSRHPGFKSNLVGPGLAT